MGREQGIAARARSRPGAAGFTLLEVLVAFVIAAPALALLFGQGVTSVTAARRAAMNEDAIARAKSRLDAIADQSLRPGEQGGDDGGGFHWRTVIVPLASSGAGGQGLRNSPYAAGSTLYSVTVELALPGNPPSGTVTLQTRRIGPGSVTGP